MPRRILLALLAALASVAAVLALPAGPALAGSFGPEGPDVASYQHPSGASIDWTQVQGSGEQFTFIKATEGTTYTNPYFSADWQDSANAGLIHGAYHYARPYADMTTAQTQAQSFANTIGPQNVPGTLPPVLDLEETGGLSPTDLQTWVSAFLSDVESLTGRIPMIYTYPTFWQNAMANSTAFNSYPLWIASYGVSSPTSLTWSNWTFWQYSSSGTVPGISTTGGTDVNQFNGTPQQLTDLALGPPPPPSPSASPSPGSTAPPPQNLSSGPRNSRYLSVAPVRFVDTRSGLGAPAGPTAAPITIQVPSQVPPDSPGVVLNVSAVHPAHAGFLRASAAGTQPTTTALNFAGGQSVTGLVVTPMDAQGRVTLTPYDTPTDIVVDLVGYYTASSGTGGHWNPIPPTRFVDTRSGLGAPSGQRSGDLTVTIPNSVPADASGVVLDVSVVNPAGDGYLRLAPAGTTATTTALNVTNGQSVTGLAVTRTNNRQLTVSLYGSPADLVLDVVGYYDGSATAGSTYVATAPQRFLDTRSGMGATGPISGAVTVSVPASVPASATGVVLDVSVVTPNGSGYLRLAAAGDTPTTTSVNFRPGQNTTGLAISAIRNGQITLTVYGASTQLVADLVGYHTS